MGGVTVIDPVFREWLVRFREAAEASQRLNDELGALMLQEDDSDSYIGTLVRLSERAEEASDAVAKLAHAGVTAGGFDLIEGLLDLHDALRARCAGGAA
ncbi:hypothetical protein NHN26_16900 [Rhodovulum tesquicola]|uniref:hypothetical protein n=1 Tax=Rhodovulum tesquicola TaxID=540254 RepID=UPI0020985559|nr:hypothetical protein [Rhodovulum tesquicola]MCO8146884.1 hypothetical protein [Rhodovulum tesquicola]